MNQNDDKSVEFLMEYLPQIIRLAEKNLAPRYAPRFSPEDVAESVIRTVFGRMKKGTFTFDDDESLWKQLVIITKRRLKNKVRDAHAAKRSINRTTTIDEDFFTGSSREPDPAEANEFTELLQRLGGQLDQNGRRILELRMAGYSYAEISDELGVSDRTVGRKIKLIKELLQKEAEV